MSLHCPDWIFDAATASVAFEFLSSDLPIETFASKYCEGLAEYYVAIDADEYYKGASLLLEFLSEVEVGEDGAVDVNSWVGYGAKQGRWNRIEDKPSICKVSEAKIKT